MKPIQDHYAIPDIVTGYPPLLDGCFSVITPEATANISKNPSFEFVYNDYYNLNSCTLALDSTHQRRGVNSLRITPNAGVEAGIYYTELLIAGQPYAISVDLLGEPGKWYNLYINPLFGKNSAVCLTRVKGTGYWQRVKLIYPYTIGGTNLIRLSRDSYADTNPFWTDGWQIENKDHCTTYCDGDMKGFVRGQVDYGWQGTPHASASYRTGQTKSGGIEVNLKDIGLTILSVLGLGLGSLGNVATSSVDGGSYYQRTVRKDRQFTIAGSLAYTNLTDLMRTRKALQSALDAFSTAKTQPMLMRYQQIDENGDPASEKVDIRALYNSGLGGQYDNDYAENVGITFDVFLPLIMNEGESGASLSYNQTVMNANNIIMRDNAGLWKALSTGVNDTVSATAVMSDGRIVVGGNFTLAGGVTNTAYIAIYDPATGLFTPMSTGANGSVATIAIGPDGNVYVGGSFTSVGGVANTSRIAYWNGAWHAMGTGANGTVGSTTIGPDGKVYIGGSFTSVGGVANTLRIAYWDGTWHALGTGADGAVESFAIGPTGLLYIGGSFTNINGTAVSKIGIWNGTAAIPMGPGLNSDVATIAIGPDGKVYAGGAFTLTGGSRIAFWNGSVWSPLGGGTNGFVSAITITQDGLVYVGGAFTVAGSLTLLDGLVVWNGSTWVYVDIDIPNNATPVYSIVVDKSSNLYVGYAANGNAVTSYVNTVTSLGTASASPTIKFTGPGTVYQIKNVNTGKTIYFNLTLLAGETATLTLDPNNITFVSSFRGNIRDSILRGSNMDLTLQGSIPNVLHSGDNLISVFVAGTTTAATATAVTWRDAYASLDGAIH